MPTAGQGGLRGVGLQVVPAEHASTCFRGTLFADWVEVGGAAKVLQLPAALRTRPWPHRTAVRGTARAAHQLPMRCAVQVWLSCRIKYGTQGSGEEEAGEIAGKAVSARAAAAAAAAAVRALVGVGVGAETAAAD